MTKSSANVASWAPRHAIRAPATRPSPAAIGCRLKELERENARLKRSVGKQASDIAILKEARPRETRKPAAAAPGGGACVSCARRE